MPIVDPSLEAYAEAHSTAVPDLLVELRDVTQRETTRPGMQVGPVEGRFLELLVRLTGARRVLEIGMFTGYSALMMAAGLPEDGELVTLDRDPDAHAIARGFFERSPHGGRIRVVLGEALESLQDLEGPFDLCFLDADKEHYPDYYEAVLPLLRPGGLLVADNVLWSGRVADAGAEEASTRALRTFNDRVATDPRVEAVMLTLRDGVTLARKR